MRTCCREGYQAAGLPDPEFKQLILEKTGDF